MRGLRAFGIEGYRAHERALNAGVMPRWTLVSTSMLTRADERGQRLLDRLRDAAVPLTAAPDTEFEAFTGGRELGALASLIDLPHPTDLEELTPRAGTQDTFLVGVDVEDPGNVGALVRTALASGAKAYVRVGPGDPYHPRAVRTSMGSLFRQPIALATLDELIAACRRDGIVLAGSVCRGGQALHRVDWPRQPVALLLGSEAFGLSPEVRNALDLEITIPMPAGVDSYSVNAAAAVLLWERQRALRPGC